MEIRICCCVVLTVAFAVASTVLGGRGAHIQSTKIFIQDHLSAEPGPGIVGKYLRAACHDPRINETNKYVL